MIVHNILSVYTKSMLCEELDSLGCEDEYDFIYVPTDKSIQWNFGYDSRFVTDYTFARFEHGSRKVVQIAMNADGLEMNLKYYSSTVV